MINLVGRCHPEERIFMVIEKIDPRAATGTGRGSGCGFHAYGKLSELSLGPN